MHILFVYDMLACCFVTIAPTPAKINDEDEGGLLTKPNQEVIRLDISI